MTQGQVLSIHKATKNPYKPIIQSCGTTEHILNIYLCCKRYIHSTSLQSAVSDVSFHRGLLWKLQVLYISNITKLRTWCSHFWVSKATKEGHNSLQEETSTHFDTIRWTAIYTYLYTQRECARMSRFSIWNPFNFTPEILIFTCKFIEVISNVISQVVVSRVLIVYELHITYVRHNSNNIRVRIKQSTALILWCPLKFWEKTKTYTQNVCPVGCTLTFQGKTVIFRWYSLQYSRKLLNNYLELTVTCS